MTSIHKVHCIICWDSLTKTYSFRHNFLFIFIAEPQKWDRLWRCRWVLKKNAVFTVFSYKFTEDVEGTEYAVFYHSSHGITRYCLLSAIFKYLLYQWNVLLFHIFHFPFLLSPCIGVCLTVLIWRRKNIAFERYKINFWLQWSKVPCFIIFCSVHSFFFFRFLCIRK